MYRGLTVGAIIAAAGHGKRMKSNVNKQYLLLDGKPILAHTLQMVSSTPYIDIIVLVTGEDEIEYCRKEILEKYNVSKTCDIVKGGSERQQSIMEGLNALKGRCSIVVTHDGARPFASTEIIEESISHAYECGAAACAVPVKDTIKVMGTDNFITGTPDRSTLYAVQTPQTFKFDFLYKAHVRAREEGFLGTDDTVLVEKAGGRVRLFPGSYENIKITTPEDIYIAEAIVKYHKERNK